MEAKWLLRCDNVYDSAARVANRICGLVAGGARYCDIVVVLADFDDAATIYEQTFAQYEIPTNIDVGKCLMDTIEAKQMRDAMNHAPWAAPAAQSTPAAPELEKVVGTIRDILGDTDIPAGEYCNMFCTLCTAVKVSDVPNFANRVFVANAKEYEPAFVPYVFVCGANDGVFPATVDDTDIITLQDIKSMTIRIEPSATQQARRARRHAENILKSATTAVFMVYCDINARGERARVTTLARGFTVAEDEPIFAPAYAKRVAFNHIGGGTAFENAEVGRYVAGLVDASGAGAVRVPTFDAVKCNIETAPPRHLSITGIERFAECPFKHFIENGLGLSPAAPLGVVDVRAVGTVLHKFAEDFVRAYVAGGAVPTRPLAAELRQFPRFVRDAIVRQCRLISKFLQSDIAASDVKPALFEHTVEGEIAGVSVRGKADRVDMGERGFVVVDYKTGGAGRVMLQLPLYMRFLGRSFGAKSPAGAYYLGLRDFKKKVIDIDAIEPAQKRATDIVRAITAGVVAQEPLCAEVCGYCLWRDMCGGRQ